MALLNLRDRLIVLLLIGLLSPVHAVSLAAEEVAPVSTAPPAVTAEAQQKEEGLVGIASYYAKRYNGRRTNSGKIYDPNRMTAAHPSLPHGTKVKVVNLSNGKEIVVTVNDRCRKRKFPFIDLSRAAANKLGFLGKGTTKVRIIPLEET